MSVEVRTAVEGRRGCGYRKPGGLYLMAGRPAEPCGLLPMQLRVCPTCGEGVKPARSWTWVQADELLGLPLAHPPGVSRGHAAVCPLSGTLGRAGLLWIGEGFYRTPEAFMEEARRMGISRRITSVPRDLDVGKTWVLLAHRSAFPSACGQCPCTALGGVTDGRCFCGHLVDGHGPRGGVFSLFRPERIEYVVRGDETDEELGRLVERGIEPVRVRPAETTLDEGIDA